jgi:hypothetical protein
MDISLVIQQLRRHCPSLGGRVGGAADFDTGVETVIALTDPKTGKYAYPAAVVIPLEDDADPNALLDGSTQTVTETVGVIVAFDAKADRRGQAGASQVDAMKYAIFRALLGWVIDPARGARGLYYAGGELLSFDRARLFWMYRMSSDATVTDGDGWQPQGDPVSVLGTIQPDDPVRLAPPVLIEAVPPGAVGAWEGFDWDDGSVWQ